MLPKVLFLARPGTRRGPCVDACEHANCNAVRKLSLWPCCLCGQPIGYEVPAYCQPGVRFVHALCVRTALAKNRFPR